MTDVSDISIAEQRIWRFEDEHGASMMLRVLRDDPRAKRLCTIAIRGSRTEIPSWLSYDEASAVRLSDGFEEMLEQPDRWLPPPRDEWSSSMLLLTKNRTRIINEALPYLESYLGSEEDRAKLIARIVTKTGQSDGQVRRTLTLYLRGGESLDAIVAQTPNCGGPDKSKSRKNPSAAAVTVVSAVEQSLASCTTRAQPLSSNDEKFIDESINTNVLTASTQRKPIRPAYTMLLAEHYVANRIEVERENALAILTAPFPTYSQYEYRARKALHAPAGVKARAGDRYGQTNRPAVRSPNRQKMGPGDAFQVDSTPLDMKLFVGYQEDLVPIGERPTLYLVRDWWSTLIVGFALFFGAPCRAALGMALWAAAVAKDELLATWGASMPPQGWRARGIATSFVFDRGLEYTSRTVDLWTEEFGFIAAVLPRRTPDWKGLDERGLGLVQTRGIHGEPGALSPAERDRGLKRTPPQYSFEAARQLLIETIVEINHSEVPDQYVDDRARAAGLGRMTRQEYYDWGIQTFGTLPSTPGIVDLSRRFLPWEMCSVGPKGFSLNGLRYLPTVTPLENFFQRGTKRKKGKVKITSDPSNVSKAYLWLKRTEPLEELTLHPDDSFYAGMTVIEVEHLLKLRRNSNPSLPKRILTSDVTGAVRRQSIRTDELASRRQEKRDLKKELTEKNQHVESTPMMLPMRKQVTPLSIAQLIDRQMRSGTS